MSTFPQKSGKTLKAFWLLCEKNLKKIKPAHPIIIVISNWLMLLTIFKEMAFMRCSSCINSILPPYSPMRLGVSIVILQPDNTDLNALINENCCTCLTSSCHFLASMPQLTNIKKNTATNLRLLQLCFTCCQRNSRSCCCSICRYKLLHKTINNTGPKK